MCSARATTFVTLGTGTTDFDVDIDAGTGTDRFVADTPDLVGNEEAIALVLSNFEEVEIGNQVDLSAVGATAVTVDVGELGFDRVITNGITGSDDAGDFLILDEMADGGHGCAVW